MRTLAESIFLKDKGEKLEGEVFGLMEWLFIGCLLVYLL